MNNLRLMRKATIYKILIAFKFISSDKIENLQTDNWTSSSIIPLYKYMDVYNIEHCYQYHCGTNCYKFPISDNNYCTDKKYKEFKK